MTHSIPQNWQEVLLDSVTKRGSGHTPNKKHPEYWDGDIKWISLKDSDRLDDLYIYDTVSKITPEGIENSSAVLHPAGTVVLSRDAGVGKSAIMKEDMAVSQHFMAWQCGSQLDNHFLYHWLQMEKPEFERIAVGSTIKTIGLSYFKHLKIVLPPLTEQLRIVVFLETWDEAIKKLQKKIIAKKAIMKILMSKLLSGKIRVSGYTDPWKQVKVGEIMKESQVKDIVSDPDKRLTVRLHLKGVVKREYRGNESTDATQYYERKAGQFIYGKQNIFRGSIGIIPPELDRFCSSQDIPAFDIESDYDIDFIYFFFARENFYKWLENFASGSGSKRLNPKNLFKIVIGIPQLKDEQKKISEILNSATNEIITLHKQLKIYINQKSYLLNGLITGRIRVPENMPIPKP